MPPENDITRLRIKSVELAIKFFEGKVISDISRLEELLRNAYSEIFLFVSDAPHSKFETINKINKKNEQTNR